MWNSRDSNNIIFKRIGPTRHLKSSEKNFDAEPLVDLSFYMCSPSTYKTVFGGKFCQSYEPIRTGF